MTLFPRIQILNHFDLSSGLDNNVSNLFYFLSFVGCVP